MSMISLRLPDSLHFRVRHLSKKDHISINQFVSTAVTEISALETEDYMNRRASRSGRKKFERALSMVPDNEPDERDRLK